MLHYNLRHQNSCTTQKAISP